MQKLIDKLEEVLSFLDENELAIPAIKVEEAIHLLKNPPSDSSLPDNQIRN